MPSNTTTTEPSQPMTAEQLQEIQTRRDAINDTPWGTRRDEKGHYTVQAGAKITPTEGFASSGTVAHIATTEDDEHGYRRADFIARAPRTIDALLAENNRLQRANTDLEQTADQALADVERLHDIADKLAYAIAPIEIIGEHSSGNDPWENALDHATPLPQVDQMRHELATRPTRAEAFREAAEIAVRVARRKNGGTAGTERGTAQHNVLLGMLSGGDQQIGVLYSSTETARETSRERNETAPGGNRVPLLPSGQFRTARPAGEVGILSNRCPSSTCEMEGRRRCAPTTAASTPS